MDDDHFPGFCNGYLNGDDDEDRDRYHGGDDHFPGYFNGDEDDSR